MIDKQDEAKGKVDSGGPPKPPAKTEKTPASAPTKKEADKARTGTRRGSPVVVLLSLLALIVALGTLGAGAWLYQEMQRLQAERGEVSDRLQRLDAALQSRPTGEALEKLRHSVDTFATSLQETKTQIESQESSRQQLLSRIEGRLDTVSSEQEMLQQSIANLRDVMGRDDTAWVLADVENLLRIANHRVRLENDLSGGIQALEAADARLRELGDPAALPVRSAIADEIAQLRNVQRPDLPGIALRLQAAASQLRQLGPGKSPAPISSTAPSTAAETAAVEPSTLAGKAWSWLTSLVSITRLEAPTKQAPKPGITKARQAIEADLAFARFALLDHDPAAYRKHLAEASQTLRDNFDTDDTAVANLLDELESLHGAQLSVEVPGMGASLAALKIHRSARQGPAHSGGAASPTGSAPASQTE
jgi:uroporphyrin-3 C-methyltransferase